MEDRDVRKYTSGGGCLMLFGFPFFAFGLAAITGPLWGMDESSDGGALGLVLFGFVFFAVGSAIMFGRAGVIVDRRNRRITKWWGLLVPFRRTVTRLEEIEAVTISKEIRRSDKSSYTVYPVRLEGRGKIKIREPRDYGEARTMAEELAKFLEMGIKDRSQGEEIVREAGTLDESLRERVRRTGEGVKPPDPPAGCRTRYRFEGNEAEFEIPSSGFRIGHFILMAIGLGIAGFSWLFFFRAAFGSADGFRPIYLFGAAFMGIPVLVTTGLAFRSATLREKVSVSSDRLRVEKRSFLRRSAVEIPANELEELTVGRPIEGRRGLNLRPVEVISARSDRVVIEFGHAIGGEEILWLRDSVKFILTAG